MATEGRRFFFALEGLEQSGQQILNGHVPVEPPCTIDARAPNCNRVILERRCCRRMLDGHLRPRVNWENGHH
ncbi:hypothetical protein RB11636 [Rhodopirellula baltica SH 1]|uniref:Uncharacterized protein n=1 Tax=Rhodopirellula baltica (strain DSM 10527 / NCIMB 13988 / SH1) TaxID=243090 RepID=Q7UE23_RHOBA|nr:hypothetical protein RB11636 [Rhodopirellula baltica SH 1]